jgi:hypothetical protein
MRLKPSKSLIRAVLAPLLLLAGVLFFFRHVLFLPGYVIPWDMRGYHLPLAVAYADALAERAWPFWEPFTYCGRPLLANPQAAVLYPGMFVAAAGGRQGLLQRLELVAILHVFLAGWITYLLGRRLGLSLRPAILGGFMLALGAFPASQAQHWSSLCGLPWMALSWLALLLAPAWRLPVLALAFSLLYLAGFPAFALAAAASTFVLACALWTAERANWRLPADTVVAGALAAALCGVQLVPAMELIRNSVGRFRTDWLEGGGGMPPAALASLVWPNYHGLFDLKTYNAPYELTQLYLFSSVSGLVLAVYAATRLRGRRWRAVAAVGLISFALMFGASSPLARALNSVLPAFVRNGMYWYFFMAPFLLALSLLAGFGAECLPRKRALQTLAAALVAFECLAVSSNRPMNTQREADEPLVSETAVDGIPEIARALREAAGDLRFDTVDDGVYLMSSAPILRLRAGNGYDPLALERLIQARLTFARGARWGAYYQVEDLAAPTLDAMSVRAVTSRRALPPSRWRKIAALPGRGLYLNDQALPRYRVVGKVAFAGSLEEAVRILNARTLDLAKEAVVEGFAPADGGGSVRVIDERRNRVLLETETRERGYLVTSEAHYPGWRARVDGREQAVHYTNVAFRGLPVPAGRHRVELYYQSDTVAVGLWLTLTGVLVWTLLIVRAGLAARPPRHQPLTEY